MEQNKKERPIKLQNDVYIPLTKIRAKLSERLGENVTYNETIKFLVAYWEEKEQ